MLTRKMILAIQILREMSRYPGITIEQIAENIDRSVSYIEKCVTKLQPYAVGRRGCGGGYRLKVPFETIGLYHLSVALECPDDLPYTLPFKNILVVDAIQI